MGKTFLRLAPLGLALLAWGQPADISGERIRAHVKFLASDLLEGRGVGVRGGDLATEYLAAQLALAGAKPAGPNGSWFQPVALVGVHTLPGSQLKAGPLDFQLLTDFVGTASTQTPQQAFEADAVFVGHGITAPEFGWDDYAGINVKGKTVVLFTGEPPSEDPAFFGGRALTYYGRWTYKYEQALRQGAAAAIILHTTSTAGDGWEVVRNSWGREEFAVKRSGDALAFAGWLSQEAAARLAAAAAGGKTVDEWLRLADPRGFKAFPLGLKIGGKITSKVRDIATRNVAGIVPGSDTAVAAEVVIYSAHWDHLGINDAAEGDRIYNGAVDNATGCGMLLEIARAWAGAKVKPRRSALFVFMAAEESGLRGSEYYVQQPLAPLGQTSLVLNFDSYFPFGRVKDVVLTGAERTTFWPQIQDVARRYELTVSPDPRPEQGSFFRSDHFPFAKAGVAAFSVNGGSMFVANAEASAARLKEYGVQSYHQPSDEYRDDWDFSNMEYLARFGAALGQEAANAEALVKVLPVEPRKPVLTGAAKPARRLHRAAPRRRK
ncbi:MAG: M28 family peptidase [Bryobacterales bacterium]|nr:M28 family peptidase [Bryobacterales bacterium]